MEKLPEKWCIKNDYQEVRDYLAKYCGKEKIKNWTTYEYIGYYGGNSDNGALGAHLRYHENYGSVEITFEQFKKFVLGEPDKFIIKAGDLVEIIDSPSLRNWFRWKEAVGYRFFVENSPLAIDMINEGGESSGIDAENKYGINYSLSSLKLVSIPQQEERVEYCELIRTVSGLGETGRVYPVKNGKLILNDPLNWHYPDTDRFKPSTRAAYEAQQNKQFEQHVEKLNTINQVSQLKTNKNGNEKSSEVNDSMDSDTRGTRGQEIRLRTKSLRVICESGSSQVGREVSKTRGGRKRTKAEIGERFV